MLDCGMHMGYNDNVSNKNCSICVCFMVGLFRDVFQTSRSSQTLVD